MTNNNKIVYALFEDNDLERNKTLLEKHPMFTFKDFDSLKNESVKFKEHNIVILTGTVNANIDSIISEINLSNKKIVFTPLPNIHNNEFSFMNVDSVRMSELGNLSGYFEFRLSGCIIPSECFLNDEFNNLEGVETLKPFEFIKSCLDSDYEIEFLPKLLSSSVNFIPFNELDQEELKAELSLIMESNTKEVALNG